MTKRKTNTEQYLKEALTLLLKEKPFEDITISQLTQKAGINRGTFYLHYRDKQDMMQSLKDQTLEQLSLILNTAKSRSTIQELLIETFQYLKEQFDFIQTISKIPSACFSENLKDFAYRFILTFPHAKTAIAQYYGVPHPYAIQIYLAGIESLITYWIATGGKERPKEMAAILIKALRIEDIFP